MRWTIKDHWRFISRDCCLSEEEFIKAVQFVLDSTFIVFDSVIRVYRQNYRTPMDSYGLSVISRHCGSSYAKAEG